MLFESSNPRFKKVYVFVLINGAHVVEINRKDSFLRTSQTFDSLNSSRTVVHYSNGFQHDFFENLHRSAKELKEIKETIHGMECRFCPYPVK